MILEEETFEGFGYYPYDLKPKSNKRILAACDDCGKVRIQPKQAYHSLCLSCACKNRISEKAPNWQGGKLKRICKGCGKEFTVVPSKIKNSRGIFCSRKCKGKWWGKEIAGDKSPTWKGGKIIRVCQQCDKKFAFRPSPSRIKNGRGIFCSHSCARKAQKIPTHHTKPELIFEDICKKYDLHFKYTGNGAFWIGKLNPDFIECNDKKIVVEIFGDYWHSPLLRYDLKKERTLTYRKRYYIRHKWIPLIIWESDLLRVDAEKFILIQLNKVFKNE